MKREFSPKELEVLALICEGEKTSEIALKMGSSVKTIESYRSGLLRKSKCKNMMQLCYVSGNKNFLNNNSI